MSATARASANILRWRRDPVAFVRENFKCEPDAWQKTVLEALPHNQRLAMKACKGPGKTCLIAWVCWWFLTCFLHPKIAATSITGDNLADGLWAEMAKWRAKSPFLLEAFEWTKTRIFSKDHPETWFMTFRTWPKGGAAEQQANTLAGLHADNIMFVLDEAGGIPDAVMAAAEAALANDHGDGHTNAKLLMAGNPTHNEGPLYRACTTERHLWHVTEITSDPDDPKRTPRVSIEWARAQILKYGADNPWVLVNVFGKFPPSSINSLIGPDEVRAAMERHLQPDQYEWSQKRLGVDVARFGDDATVLFPRQGLAAFNPVIMRNADNAQIGARVITAATKFNHELEMIDGTGGWGGGVIDFLRASGRSPLAYQASGSPTDSRYANKRAEVWFRMTSWVKSGGCLPPSLTEIVGELTTPTYTFNKSGKLIIEPKEEIKVRLGRSPDLADALSMTFMLDEMSARIDTMGLVDNRGKVKSDWDPFKNA